MRVPLRDSSGKYFAHMDIHTLEAVKFCVWAAGVTPDTNECMKIMQEAARWRRDLDGMVLTNHAS